MPHLPILILVISALFVGLIIGFFAGRVSSSDTELPQPPGPPLAAPDVDVEALMRAGKMIEAIKLHRQQTGCGLKEAKDAVDALRERMG